jgi:hypothetical protein
MKIAWWIFPWQTVSHNQMVILSFLGSPSSNIKQVEFHDISSDGEDVLDAEQRCFGSPMIYGCLIMAKRNNKL